VSNFILSGEQAWQKMGDFSRLGCPSRPRHTICGDGRAPIDNNKFLAAITRVLFNENHV
jgi:hypothetical protein